MDSTYYARNRDKVLKRALQKIQCPICNSTLLRTNMPTHSKSKRCAYRRDMNKLEMMRSTRMITYSNYEHFKYLLGKIHQIYVFKSWDNIEMKRSHSAEDLTAIGKKRKCNLTIQPIYALPCDICKTLIPYYGYCIGQFVYCGVECFEILVLRHINNVQRNSFHEEDLMVIKY